jgi:hypothetical protein
MSRRFGATHTIARPPEVLIRGSTRSINRSDNGRRVIVAAMPKTKPQRAQLSRERALELLRLGFIEGSDARARRAFLAGWPRPADKLIDIDGLLRDLGAKPEPKRLAAARSLLRSGCKLVGSLQRALCHPMTIEALLAQYKRERSDKVRAELGSTLGILATRGLPDLRLAPVLEQLLAHPKWQTRAFCVEGLVHLTRVPWRAVIALLDDKQAGVRAAVCRAIAQTTPLTARITNDGELKREPIPRAHIARLEQARNDPDQVVRNWAGHAVLLNA